VREVPVWVGDLFMPGQVLAYDVVSTAGRKMRVESSAKVHRRPGGGGGSGPGPLWPL
jgi:hypothetical protein